MTTSKRTTTSTLMPNDPAPPPDRYAKQTRFAPLGEEGQRRLAESRVLLCGCGALGSVLAQTLVRAGVGSIRIVDRDYLELSNLQRQVLFTEQDVADRLPKAVAAAEHLRRANSSVEIEPVVADVTHKNLARLAEGADLLLDGTDNFETRLLVNDFSIDRGVPWVYGGVIGAEGRVMPIVPGETACLACLVPEPPGPGERLLVVSLLVALIALARLGAVVVFREPEDNLEGFRDGRIAINCTGEAELQLLPGIGPTRARAIAERRARHGPYRSPRDLEAVPGIGRRTAERLEPYIDFRTQP